MKISKKNVSIILALSLLVGLFSQLVIDGKVDAANYRAKDSSTVDSNTVTYNAGQTEALTGYEAVYQNNLSIYTNQRSDDRMMEYLLMEPDNEYAYLINDDIRAVCKEITADCTSDMEKLQAIHDWVCNNIYYDQYGLHNGGAGRGAIYVFDYRGTICCGYSDLTAAMCREVGIPCKEMEGFVYENDDIEGMELAQIREMGDPSTEHAWNEAWVDGRWVLMDNTWDSRNANTPTSQEVTYKPCVQTYFDMDLEEFSKTHFFYSYISFFEFKFDEWNKKTSSTSTPLPVNTPVVTQNPTTTKVLHETEVPSATMPPATTKVPSVSSGSAVVSKASKNVMLINTPSRVKIKKLKKAGQACMKITWSGVKCNNGYQIQISRKRSFSKKETETTYGESLYYWGKSKKTYYVRVRAVNYGCKTQSEYGYKYGSWSPVKKIKLK